MFFLNKENLHHAYLLEGEKEEIFQKLLRFLEKDLRFSVKRNLDFWSGDFDSFGIDNSREIKDFQSRKAINEGKKIIAIKTNFITSEAQNSLLKIFEEPTENTHLFLIMPSSEAILPTLKSRLAVINNVDIERPHLCGRRTSTASATEFLGASIAERFELIKKFLPKKGEKVDKMKIISFLNDLEVILHQNFWSAWQKGAAASPPPLSSALENSLTEIIKCRSYLNGRSPSAKMILEHLSQTVPQLGK